MIKIAYAVVIDDDLDKVEALTTNFLRALQMAEEQWEMLTSEEKEIYTVQIERCIKVDENYRRASYNPIIWINGKDVGILDYELEMVEDMIHYEKR